MQQIKTSPRFFAGFGRRQKKLVGINFFIDNPNAPVFIGGKIEKLEKTNLSPPRGEIPQKSIDGTTERDAAIFGAKKLVATNFSDAYKHDISKQNKK